MTKKDGVFYLITAKHVLERARLRNVTDDKLYVFINGQDGTIHQAPIADTKQRFGIDWILATDSDLAIIPISLRTKEDDVKVFPDGMYLDPIEIAPMRDVFFVSYQPGIENQNRIIHIVRRGMVSVINDDASFYMDAFAFPGNSGSPVFVRSSPVTKSGDVFSFGDPSACKFVGILGAYLPYKEMAVSEQTGEPRVMFQENTGLALVWTVEAIRKLMASPEFNVQHKKLVPKVPPEAPKL